VGGDSRDADCLREGRVIGAVLVLMQPVDGDEDESLTTADAL
jgi:hypothetical protein